LIYPIENLEIDECLKNDIEGKLENIKSDNEKRKKDI